MKFFDISHVHASVPMLLLIAGSMALSSVPLYAETESLSDAVIACRDAADLAEADNIDAAVEEARWCLEVLEQIHSNAALASFPDSVGDWVGQEPEDQSALGMSIMSRTYINDDQSLKVSVTTGPAGSGLAALAQLGASLGAGNSQKFRVQRRSVLDMSDQNGSVAFLVQLRSGGAMNVESTDTDAADVRSFLKAFPVADLDDALKN